MLTKLKMAKYQAKNNTYTDHLYEVCRETAYQINHEAFEGTYRFRNAISSAVHAQVFNQIERSLRETHGAY